MFHTVRVIDIKGVMQDRPPSALVYELIFTALPGYSWASPKYVFTTRSLLWCKTLPANSGKRSWLIVYPTLFKSTISDGYTSRGAWNSTLNICSASNSKFEITKPFYISKRTNKKGRQNLRGFPRHEITRIF